MGSKLNPEGIEIRGDRIRIVFHWKRKRYREAYPYPASPESIKRASKLRDEVVARISMGIFDNEAFSRLFPDSKSIQNDSRTSSFESLSDTWLNGLDVSENSKNEYGKLLDKYWKPALGYKDISSIRHRDLRSLIKEIPWSSSKTRNNALIPLRGVFHLALEDELIDQNPMMRIRNQKHQSPPPDPFTREEAEIIVGHLYERFGNDEAVHAAYFEFAFFTGMRTSEMLALQWSDVDFRQGYARVEKAQSKGRLNDRTKTAKVRDVMLNERALKALSTMKRLTFLQGEEIFRSGRTGDAYKTEKAQRYVFTQALKKLGIRHRPAYNTRHTYATMLLMAGANPNFVAAQLGHSVTMTLTKYSKWLQGDQDRMELAKLDVSLPAAIRSSQ